LSIFKETFVDHGSSGTLNIIGSYSTGVISSSIINSAFNGVIISKIKSEHNKAIGMFINNKSKNVTVKNMSVNSIKSNETRGDSSMILVDENSKNIFIYDSFYNVNTDARKFKYLFLFFISIVILYIINLIPFHIVISNCKKIFFKRFITM